MNVPIIEVCKARLGTIECNEVQPGATKCNEGHKSHRMGIDGHRLGIGTKEDRGRR